MTGSPDPDYSLYYVTGRELTPPSVDFFDSLEEACRGGVTIVQLREKEASTREFLEIAKKAKAVVDKYGIPLLINDRLDIALAVKCGLHVGQDDFPATVAREMLGPDVLIGVSVNTAEELEEVLSQQVADYVGIGPTDATSTKKDHNPALGVRGTRDLLARLEDSPIKTVAIGGLNAATIPNLLAQSPAYVEKTGRFRKLDGVAVVSAIAASTTPKEAAAKLAALFKDQKTEFTYPSKPVKTDVSSLTKQVMAHLTKLRETPPSIVQHITNQVVMNDTANLTLALASSPIMSGNPEEVDDLGSIVGAVVLNMGTLNDRQLAGATGAGRAANRNHKPVILDPVGVGATAFRRGTISTLMNDVHVTIIKGNAGEIGAIAGVDEVKSRGVDSDGNAFKDPAAVVRNLARREKCIVVMSGVVDYISDGKVVVAIENGHEYQGVITGSGCMATTAIASFATVLGVDNAFEAAIAGVLTYNIAAEVAAGRPDVKGPNTFRAALIDEAYNIQPDQISRMARLKVV